LGLALHLGQQGQALLFMVPPLYLVLAVQAVLAMNLVARAARVLAAI
jgi:hypothetical protein